VRGAVRRECEHAFVPRYAESELREVAARASSLSEILRHFRLRPAGGNHRLLRRWLDEWGISTDHFAGTPPPPRREPVPLEAVMVAGSRYQRRQLKQRLYDSGLKARSCELCGQGEEWRGRRMALILDHINGVADDNRLENLQIVCPNCAATLDTHCGRANRVPVATRTCLHCGGAFDPRSPRQRYCCRACGLHAPKPGARPAARRGERPPYEDLVAEVAATSWRAVGRRYGVSDNAVRKWVRAYERERARVLLER
jgi:HNH endonuclease